MTRSPTCLATEASSPSTKAYPNPMMSGAGGRKCFRPTVHTVPLASASPPGVVLRTRSGAVHHALITARESHAELRHRHAAPACARLTGGTRPHHPSSSEPRGSLSETLESSPPERASSSTNLRGGALTMVTGAPATSACTYASSGPRYFVTSASACAASLALSTRQFSGVTNQ